MEYTPSYDPFTGRFLGVVKNGTFIPNSPGNADWEALGPIDTTDKAPPTPQVQLQELRDSAQNQLLTSIDPRDVALRSTIRIVFTKMNDLVQSIGGDRILEPIIIGEIVQGIQTGLGEPAGIPTPPPAPLPLPDTVPDQINSGDSVQVDEFQKGTGD